MRLAVLLFVWIFILACKPGPSFSSCQVGSYTLTAAPSSPRIYVDERPANNISSYLITLKIGSQSQANNLVFDTGSSDTLVQGSPSICPNCDFSSGSTFYQPTGTSLSTGIALGYGDGTSTATADVYQDAFDMSCTGVTSLSQFDMDFLVLTRNNITGLRDGILGVAYPSLSKLILQMSSAITFFKGFLDNHTSLGFKNLFAVTLCGNLSGSRVVLGNYDQVVPENSTFQWTPVTTNPAGKYAYYSIGATDFWVKDWDYQGTSWSPKAGAQTSLGAFISSGMQTIIDTGTTLTLLNAEQTQKLKSLMLAVNTQKNLGINPQVFEMSNASLPISFSAPQSTLQQFPKLGITVSPNIQLEILPQTYFKNWDHGLIFGFDQTGSLLQILGQTFMEGYHIVFDLDQNRIGFASNAQICGK